MVTAYRIGLASYSFHRALASGELSTEALIRMAAVDLGCGVLEFAPPWEQGVERDTDGLRHLRELLETSAVEPIIKVNPGGSYPLAVEGDARTALLSTMDRRLRAACALGARVVRIVARANQHPPGWTPTRRNAALVHNLRALCRTANDLSLVLALENHADLRAAEIEQLLDTASSPCLRLTLDAANCVLMLENPLAVIRRLLPHAVSVHLKNYRAVPYASGFRLTCCRPHEGIIDFRAVLRALRQAPPAHDIALLVESHVEGDLDEGIVAREYLTEVRKCMSPLAGKP